jgi:hypothetical protein
VPENATPARSVTRRGFINYDEFTDSYGSNITVRQSSSAAGPRVWIFAEHDPADRYLSAAERQLIAGAAAAFGARLTPTPHLDVAQARRLRHALDVFITENGGA